MSTLRTSGSQKVVLRPVASALLGDLLETGPISYSRNSRSRLSNLFEPALLPGHWRLLKFENGCCEPFHTPPSVCFFKNLSAQCRTEIHGCLRFFQGNKPFNICLHVLSGDGSQQLFVKVVCSFLSTVTYTPMFSSLL